MSNNYEPELMYALDSKGEYSDWKNIYNVSGDDVCYCPICLGRVKLWNGQDPDRIYKKQRCFHHIDGMCSQESRIHFAYKTWLLEPNSKFKVNENIYEVKNANIEKTLNTTYGNYRPDIVIETVDGKIFYAEVADTNKKTDDYILKWDELGNDVIEIDVNEQLVFATVKDMPVFNLIYSSTTGECHIKKYVRQDYDELLSERKIYWKHQDLLNYKIKWEKLDWFWRDLQNYYNGDKTLSDVCKIFSAIDFEDQKFICTRFKNGKHKNIRYELEKYYNNKEALEYARQNRITQTIRKLNKEFGFSSVKGNQYLGRDKGELFLYPYYQFKCEVFVINENTTEQDIYNYFHPVMYDYYHKKILPKLLKKKEKEQKEKENIILYDDNLYEIKTKFKNSKNQLWNFDYDIYSDGIFYSVSLKCFEERIWLSIQDIEQSMCENFIQEKIKITMENVLYKALQGSNRHGIRLMEER